MRKMKVAILVAMLLLSLGTFEGAARADKSAVELEAPDQVAKGTKVTIRVHVAHSANNFLHHTNWVRVKADGEESKNWEYSMSNLPESARFTKEATLLITGPCELEAEANCNLHGSKGPARKTIAVAPSAQ